jgi:cyclin-A
LQRFVLAALHATQVEIKCLEYLSRYILELSLLDYNMLAYRPSTIAAATLLLARILLAHMHNGKGDVCDHVVWTKTLEHYAFHSAHELEACVRKLHKTLLSATSCDGKSTAVTQKYRHPRRGAVACLHFMPVLPAKAFEQYVAFQVPVAYLSHVT